MAYTERPAGQQEHNIILTGRKTLKITGVSHVDRFDDEEIEIVTCMGAMTIQGQGMHMEKLSLETGEIVVAGEIEGMLYERASTTDRGLFKRLFK